MSFAIPANAIGGNGPLTYTWGNGLGTNSSINVTLYSTTTYVVTVSDACALLNAVDSVTITMPPYDLLRVYPSPDLTTCPGDSVTLSATATGGIGNYSFLWSNGLGTNSTVSVAPIVTTTYSVSVTDSCGLVAIGNVTVTVMTVLAEFTYEYISNNEVHFIDQSVNDASFQWDFGDGQSSDLQFPTHLYADTGIYIVQLTVTNAEGCISIVQHAIQIYPPYHLYVPNAFTPDGDGLNDYFAPIAVGVVQSEMYIFDRWGGQIYESSELNPHWDGRDSNGEKVQLGVYVYLLIYNTPTGQQHTRRGSVTLLR
jgi:gliding motility-associated-like protein